MRLLFAHHLFSEGAYDEGMAQLALCSGRVEQGAAVLVLLRMLPSLVATHMRHWLPDNVAGAQLPQARPGQCSLQYRMLCPGYRVLLFFVSLLVCVLLPFGVDWVDTLAIVLPLQSAVHQILALRSNAAGDEGTD